MKTESATYWIDQLSNGNSVAAEQLWLHISLRLEEFARQKLDVQTQRRYDEQQNSMEPKSNHSKQIVRRHQRLRNMDARNRSGSRSIEWRPGGNNRTDLKQHNRKAIGSAAH